MPPPDIASPVRRAAFARSSTSSQFIRVGPGSRTSPESRGTCRVFENLIEFRVFPPRTERSPQCSPKLSFDCLNILSLLFLERGAVSLKLFEELMDTSSGPPDKRIYGVPAHCACEVRVRLICWLDAEMVIYDASDFLLRAQAALSGPYLYVPRAPRIGRRDLLNAEGLQNTERRTRPFFSHPISPNNSAFVKSTERHNRTRCPMPVSARQFVSSR
jgi:hypothetical protein